MPQTVLCSLVGALLLVVTPAGVFDRPVPFLVLTGVALLLVQPRISAWQRARDRVLHPAAVTTAGAGVALYSGYFGAGSGIVMITLLLLTTESVVHRANGLKNVILLAADVLPALVLALIGTVVWRAVWPLALGAVVGGLIGPSIARRI
ncbi:MAG: sulfite exporter TauE/SafE family protein, partial [Janthinobacterium lividum]